MGADRAETSLAELDPESRALLELSLVRGLSDGDLAGMLGSEPDRLRGRREGVLRSLGVDSETERADLISALRGEEPATAREPAARPEPRTENPTGDEPSSGRGPRRVLWALVGGLVVAAVVALVLALASDKSDSPTKASDQQPREQPGATAPAGAPPAGLAALGEGPGRATAQIVVGAGRPKLRLAVRGLPPVAKGGYVVWLYNSISDAEELTGSRSGTFSVSPELPPRSARYEFIDVSREPGDGNRNHSGASVLRVPIKEIPRASRQVR